MSKNWYLARCRPNQESWLMNSLRGQGVDVFYPSIQRSRRGKTVAEALFPMYVFCNMDENFLEDAAIRWAPGLNYFLGIDGVPTDVPRALLKFLHEGVDRWNHEVDADKPHGTESDSSPPADAAYAELGVIFDRYVRTRRRCRLLFQIIGDLNAIDTDDSQIPASSPQS